MTKIAVTRSLRTECGSKNRSKKLTKQLLVSRIGSLKKIQGSNDRDSTVSSFSDASNHLNN